MSLTFLSWRMIMSAMTLTMFIVSLRTPFTNVVVEVVSFLTLIVHKIVGMATVILVVLMICQVDVEDVTSNMTMHFTMARV